MYSTRFKTLIIKRAPSDASHFLICIISALSLVNAQELNQDIQPVFTNKNAIFNEKNNNIMNNNNADAQLMNNYPSAIDLNSSFLPSNLTQPATVPTLGSLLMNNNVDQTAKLNNNPLKFVGRLALNSTNQSGKYQQFVGRQSNPNIDSFFDDRIKEILDYDEYIDKLEFEMSKIEAKNNNIDFDEATIIAKHHNYEELVKYLRDLEKRYPKTTKVFSIGTSVKGLDLYAIELCSNPGEHKILRPEVRLVANMHGNEVVGREILLNLARLLAENYEAALLQVESNTPSPQKFVKKLLDSTRIFILPSMNPDGYEVSIESCTLEPSGRRGRNNANQFDLNRNFPSTFQQTTPNPATQPETQALMNWAHATQVVLGATIHGGSLVVSYPFDGTTDTSLQRGNSPSPDNELFKHLAKVYSKNHKTMSSGQVCFDKCDGESREEKFEDDGTINGASWYSLYGTAQDWLYENTNSFEVSIEIGCNMYPKASQLPLYWSQNKKPLLKWMLEAHKGVKGTVKDAVSGKPLTNVLVHVQGIGNNVTSSIHGDFFRPLLPGLYNLTFVKDDYKIERAHFQVDGGLANILDIKMSPLTGDNTKTTESPTTKSPDENSNKDSSEHSLLVSILIMSLVTILILLAMIAAYFAQKQRAKRSHSMQLQTIRPVQKCDQKQQHTNNLSPSNQTLRNANRQPESVGQASSININSSSNNKSSVCL